ncbi:predicted protein [Streptomyces sp. AA4]|nr:predicted protein [Streptomyces sp. AA4]
MLPAWTRTKNPPVNCCGPFRIDVIRSSWRIRNCSCCGSTPVGRPRSTFNFVLKSSLDRQVTFVGHAHRAHAAQHGADAARLVGKLAADTLANVWSDISQKWFLVIDDLANGAAGALAAQHASILTKQSQFLADESAKFPEPREERAGRHDRRPGLPRRGRGTSGRTRRRRRRESSG